MNRIKVLISINGKYITQRIVYKQLDYTKNLYTNHKWMDKKNTIIKKTIKNKN